MHLLAFTFPLWGLNPFFICVTDPDIFLPSNPFHENYITGSFKVFLDLCIRIKANHPPLFLFCRDVPIRNKSFFHAPSFRNKKPPMMNHRGPVIGLPLNIYYAFTALLIRSR